MHEVKTVNEHDFYFSTALSKEVIELIKKSELRYRHPAKEERDLIIRDITHFLLSGDDAIAGPKRKRNWEDGWGENLAEYRKTRKLTALIPKYFDKYNIHRLRGEFVISETQNFEIKLVAVLQKFIFEKYFKNKSHIYEFGGGTGHNLIRLRAINTVAELTSLEWAQTGVDLINEVSRDLGDKKIKGQIFNNFVPDASFELSEGAGIYTFAALEQLGADTDALIDYWISQNPNLIVNIEPISELLDQNDLLQFLSVKYFEKRNYLAGYLSKLEERERNGKIVIHDKYRTGIGSRFIEGYSVVAWSPVLSD